MDAGLEANSHVVILHVDSLSKTKRKMAGKVNSMVLVRYLLLSLGAFFLLSSHEA